MANRRASAKRVIGVAALLLVASVTRAAGAADGAPASGAIEDETTYNAARGIGVAPPLAPPPAPDPGPAKWYGWQILASDLASVGCVVATKGDGCVLFYLLGGPAVHLAHARPGLAGLSLAGRILLPAIGASIGRSTASCAAPPPPPPPEDHGDAFVVPAVPEIFPCGFGPTMVGAAVGLVVAMGVDAAIGFSNPAGPDLNHALSAQRRRRSVMVPQLAFGAQDVTLGLSGTF